jgi:AbrB family looped-hinge helix DNA binding protein
MISFQPIIHIVIMLKILYNGSKEFMECIERSFHMELAKITSKGQITIPIHIRKKLNLKDGDKVIFLEENGRVVIENSTKVVLREVQEAFIGEAERLGLKSEDDVVDLVKEFRKEKKEKRYENND